MRQDREAPGSIPADATRRSESVQPMELWPGNWAERRAVTWGPRVLDKGRLARTRRLPFCCINLCAHATAPSAQMAERRAHRDSCGTRPRWRGGAATAVAGPQPVCPVLQLHAALPSPPPNIHAFKSASLTARGGAVTAAAVTSGGSRCFRRLKPNQSKPLL